MHYVVLHHTGIPEVHYDVMFETLPGSDLATWRSPFWPIRAPVPLYRLKDHRRVYLDYVGELSGHRGRVDQVAKGECAVEVGEGSVWKIEILTGATPQRLLLTHIVAAQWRGEPLENSAEGK